MGNYPGVFSGLEVIANVFLRGRHKDQSHKEKGGLTMKTEIEIMCPETKECQQLGEAGRGKE